MSTDTPTREQLFAAEIADLRKRFPTLDDSWWQAVERERRLHWRISDLSMAVAELVGRYGYHSEQHPDNTLLARLVADLNALLDRDTGSEA